MEALLNMEITPEEFDDKFRETIDTVLIAMAEHEEINPNKFYSMACLLENLAFFSPVIYGAIQNTKKPN
jgi:hypothetical protein